MQEDYGLTLPLYEHQKQGIASTLALPGGILNKSEPGTGKTLMTIGAINKLALQGFIKRVLIVCPNSLKYVWQEEFKKVDENKIEWNVEVLDGHSKKRKEQLEWATGRARGVVVTNYDSVAKLSGDLQGFRPDLIVLDECHQIKNGRAKRTKAIKSLRAPYKWALTGTPITNSPLDVWSIFDFIRPGHFSNNFYAFRNRYANVFTGAGFPLIKGYKNLGELKEKIAKFSFGFTKKECLDLPEKIYSKREFELSPRERTLYDEMALQMVTECEGEEVLASTTLVKLLRLHQLTGGSIGMEDKTIVTGSSKLDALKELLEELEGEKVVIWAHFREEIKRISLLLGDMKRDHYMLTGDVSTQDRQQNVAAFQASDKPCVMIGNCAVGGVGITLTAASHAIFYSNTWSYGERIQAEDRIHRISQLNKVTYYDIIARQTIDARILSALNKKEGWNAVLTQNNIRAICKGE